MFTLFIKGLQVVIIDNSGKFFFRRNLGETKVEWHLLLFNVVWHKTILDFFNKGLVKL
jgi:hypothetical protein